MCVGRTEPRSRQPSRSSVRYMPAPRRNLNCSRTSGGPAAELESATASEVVLFKWAVATSRA